jgi:CubicO group peptidase (beta-lactamase class C family)
MRVLLLSRIAALVAVAAPAAGATPMHPVPAAARSEAGFAVAIDGVVRDAMRRQNIPGVALVILRDGKVIHQANFGAADLEQGLPVRTETAFNIGSLSKQFLAEGILLLVQDGKVALDTPVSRYLPDAPPSWSAITIRHLLSHTGGLVREAPGFDGAKVQSDIDVIRSAYGVPLNAPAGTRFEYSNLGYFILAEVISRTSGRPWPAFFAERVFGPLGMNATQPTSLVDLIPNRARGYVWEEGRFRNAQSYLALRPSGAFTSTVADLAKWEKVLAQGGLTGGAPRAEMWMPAKLSSGETAPYGFGWRLETVDGHAEINHGGSLPGFRSYYLRYPEAKLAIIVLTNNSGAVPGEIARGIARLVLAKPGA